MLLSVLTAFIASIWALVVRENPCMHDYTRKSIPTHKKRHPGIPRARARAGIPAFHTQKKTSWHSCCICMHDYTQKRHPPWHSG